MEGPGNPENYRYVGAALGAASGLMFIRPKSIMDAVIRLVFSFVAGSILYLVLHEYMGWPRDPDHIVAAAWIVGFASWPLAGAALSAVKSRMGKGDA